MDMTVIYTKSKNEESRIEQLKKCEKYIENNDLEMCFLRYYADTQSTNGLSLESLIYAIENDEIHPDGIIIDSASRISRDTSIFYKIKERLAKMHVDLIITSKIKKEREHNMKTTNKNYNGIKLTDALLIPDYPTELVQFLMDNENKIYSQRDRELNHKRDNLLKLIKQYSNKSFSRSSKTETVFIYTRKDKNGLVQETKCNKFSKLNDINIIEVFRDSKSSCGRHFIAMLKKMKESNIDAIIVSDIGRISRIYIELEKFLVALKENDINLIIVD